MSALKKINYLISKQQKKKSILLTLLLLVGMMFEIIGIGILIPVLTVILKPEKLLNKPSIKAFLESINLLQESDIIKFSLAGLILIYLLKSIFLLSLNYFQNKFNSNLTADISNRLFKKYLDQPYSFHLSKNSSELLKNLQIEVNYFNVFLLAFIILITEVTLAFSVLLSLIYIEPLGTLVVMFFLLFFSSIFFQFTKRLSIRWGKIREQNDKSISKLLFETFGGIKEILLLNRESAYFNKNRSFNAVRARIHSKSLTLGQIPRYYLEFLSVVALVVFVTTLYSQGNNVDDLLVTLGVFVAATFRVLPSINRILSSLQQLKYYRSSIDLLFNEFSSLEDKLPFKENKVTTKLLSKQITFENLSFSYAKSTMSVLEDINLKIPKRSTTGIIGASGSGKSTFINILVGLLSPNSGKIYVDETELDYDNISAWRKNIGYVSQHVYLSDNSIMENIAFGIEPDNISIERINHVIQEAQLSELINSLPQGYRTRVGERGVQLSGGQQQRIGIARALYNNPEVLILDEATSALDTKTEENIMRAVNSLKSKKTIIIVTHRLTTLKGCNSIYEIKKGKIKKSKMNLVYNE